MQLLSLALFGRSEECENLERRPQKRRRPPKQVFSHREARPALPAGPDNDTVERQVQRLTEHSTGSATFEIDSVKKLLNVIMNIDEFVY